MSSLHFLMGMLILLSASVGLLEAMAGTKCDIHQFYNTATDKCMDCADLHVCGDPKLINKCPPQCVENLYLGALETIKAQKAQVADMSNTIKAQNEHVANMTSTIKAQNEHVANMASTIKAQNEQAANMSNTIKALNEHVVNMESTIKAQSEHAANMSNTIKAQNERAANMASTIKAQNEHAANMSNTFKILEKNIDNLSSSKTLWMTMAICFIILFICMVFYVAWKNRLFIIKFIRKVCTCVKESGQPPAGDSERPPLDEHDTGTERDPLVGGGHDDVPPTADVPPVDQPPQVSRVDQPPHIPQVDQPPHVRPGDQPPHIPPVDQPPHAPIVDPPPHVSTVTGEVRTPTNGETPVLERFPVVATESVTRLPVHATPDGVAEGNEMEEADRHNKDKTGDVLPSFLGQGRRAPPGSLCAPSLEEPETEIKQPWSEPEIAIQMHQL